LLLVSPAIRGYYDLRPMAERLAPLFVAPTTLRPAFRVKEAASVQ
jgi:hypothetical protein